MSLLKGSNFYSLDITYRLSCWVLGKIPKKTFPKWTWWYWWQFTILEYWTKSLQTNNRLGQQPTINLQKQCLAATGGISGAPSLASGKARVRNPGSRKTPKNPHTNERNSLSQMLRGTSRFTCMNGLKLMGSNVGKCSWNILLCFSWFCQISEPSKVLLSRW